MLSISLLLTNAALATDWVVDGTSLAAVRGQEPVASHVECPAPVDGRTLHTLGAAVVAYAKKQGTMTWGHASLRLVYCVDQDLIDAEYEVYRLSAWNERQLREEHAGEAFASSDWLASQRGQRVLFRNAQPVDGGWYAENQADNREIYEAWLALSREQLDEITKSIEQRYATQLEGLREQRDIERRFVPWADNCTSVFEVLPPEVLDDVGGAITPFAWMRRLSRAGWVRHRILYPSHHLVRKWNGELPSRSRRLHPIFRRPRALPLPLVGELHRRWLRRPPAVAAVVTPPTPLTSGIFRP